MVGAWTGSEGPWTDEAFHTDHVHGHSSNANYHCYDRDITDHVGKCSNSADTPAGTDCAAAFAAASTYGKDSCDTAGAAKCSWTAAPSSPAPKPPHPAAEVIPGYSVLSGACRTTSPANAADSTATPMQDRPPYMYTKNANFPTLTAGFTLAELATKCDNINILHKANPGNNPATCLGFHSGPWVSLFGLKIADPGQHNDLGGWAGYDEGSGAVDLTGTKPNAQYVCYIKDPKTAADGDGDGSESASSESADTALDGQESNIKGGGGDSGLSDGAVAGVAIGCIIGGFLIGAALIKFTVKPITSSHKMGGSATATSTNDVELKSNGV
jgi:hypothetical protein